MATSYLSKEPQFNPYIQQLPVDEMIAVGKRRQAQYDEGVQRIQQNIDNVAGLEVSRDVDKRYLQSKLNKLGNDLQFVAAGDFSNFQLVNSVNGMTNQIVQDKYVQNGVASAAYLKKQNAKMETADKAGKSSVQNKWDFNQNASKFLASQDLNETFHSDYQEYTDVNKKWTDILEKLHPNFREEDDPYTKNADGTLDIAAAMKRLTSEGVSKQQIDNAIRASMSPDDINQLGINGRYDFRGATPEMLGKHATETYSAELDNVDKNIAAMKTLASMSGSNPEVRARALESVTQLEASKVGMKQNYEANYKLAYENPDQAKANIYREGAISQFANAYAWETKKMHLLTNPVLEAQHWEKDFGIKRDNYLLAVRSQNFTEWKGREEIGIDKENLGLRRMEHEAKLMEIAGKTQGFAGNAAIYGGLSTKIKAPVAAMQAEALAAKQSAQAGIKEIAESMGVSVGNAELLIASYNNGNKEALDVTLRSTAEQINKDNLTAYNINAAMKKERDDVYNSKEFKAQNAEIDQALAGRQGMTLTTGGKKVYFSPRELLEYQKNKGSGDIVTSSSVGTPVTIKGSPSKLSPKLKLLEQAMATGSVGTRQMINNVANSYQPLVTKHNTTLKNAEAQIESRLLEKSGNWVPMNMPINVSNKEGHTSKDNMDGLATSILKRYGTTLGGQVSGAEGLTPKEVAKAQGWMTQKGGKDDIQYSHMVQGSQNFLIMTKGNEEVVIPIVPEEASFLPKNVHSISAQESETRQALQLGGGNTNVSVTNPLRSHYQSSAFPNVQNLKVTADLRQDKGNPNLTYVNVNIKLPSDWYNLQVDNYPQTIAAVPDLLAKQTDRTIKELFLLDPRVSEKIKQEIRTLK